MSQQNQLKFSPEVFGYPLLFVLVLWIVYWVEARFNINFNPYGIYPRTVSGLRGIIFSPFIHGSLKHLFNNSVPLFVLTAALFYFYRDIRWKVLLLGLLFTGIATWAIGRPSLHIGASGVVYLLASFLFFKGIFSKQYQLTALALAVVFLYGGMLWYVFPVNPEISWEGHLSGFFVGFVFAFLFRGNPIERKKYEWEREDYIPENDPFLQQFDDDGNFIGPPKEQENLTQQTSEKEPLSDERKKTVRIVYSFKKNAKDNLE
ncbi:rhomboid family intramembrane serine protease [Aequorivita vladivostokensis]|uniref:Membrane protein n=1 Tax=Aequorivita vladivostokensis TaxID=171194 RepID=A0ABR5DMM9_9FLAO|nr:rhomboid family intramembrane serine protease [Aequorivita vladivostokensis]KJJ40014.1 membrane protein [Aequorivita vladivostokensis]MAB57522.1 rhomboid family intramembrane serine protease [Aequorivita sp.]MBF31032.1 rhomboid family intramembrane serine protease [Aequorivita sp.]HAV55359.1 rhomboid family intramembrane serine protease [Aequorivita sp.]|tara:strand:- start:47409 stop:48191 length:783 start_codon:yes stop_codon:yes gene_type:complete